jgi:hypothetical protein
MRMMGSGSSSKPGAAKLHAIYGSIVACVLMVAAYLAYAGIDTAVTLSYRDQRATELEQVRKQLMAAMPALVKGRSKEDIVKLLEEASGEHAWEKDGCTWVGSIGLQFSSAGELVHVTPVWSYEMQAPCFP